jgi:hypothetical protein
VPPASALWISVRRMEPVGGMNRCEARMTLVGLIVAPAVGRLRQGDLDPCASW